MGNCQSTDATVANTKLNSGGVKTAAVGATSKEAALAEKKIPTSSVKRDKLSDNSRHGNKNGNKNDSGTATPDDHSVGSTGSRRKVMSHSASALGLDEMIESRKEDGDITQNVVHIEVPFGKPIEEVYDGVHTGQILGSGISGLVRLVTHKATGIKYAVKCLDLGLVDTEEGLQQLREEIFIMCQLDHPNIVRLEEVYESHSEIYLVQELCRGGELFDRLDEQPDYHYTEAQCARLVKNMLCAVRYLHSKGIIHRDLKLENFLFTSGAQDSELKMIDFGLSKHFRYGEVHHEAVGTPYTVAPEVIKGSYDERCDIWAIGVITFLLLSGDPPFGGCGGPEPLMTVRGNILNGSFAFEPEDIWDTVSPMAKDFISKHLVVDPHERPTAKEAQKHPWLKEWASRTKKEDDNILNPNVVRALVNFKEFSDMRKLLCEVLSFTLLPDQIKELRKEFEKMDTDGSGEISLAALKQVLMTNAGAGSLGALKENEVEDIFNAMRVRKSETRIHWHEFLAAGLSQCQVDDRNLRLAFDRLDSDHKGFITLDDIRALFGNDASQSEESMHRMWGDSMKVLKGQQTQITYDDFLLLMKGQKTNDEKKPKEEKNLVSLGPNSRRMVVPETINELPSPDQAATAAKNEKTDEADLPFSDKVGSNEISPSVAQRNVVDMPVTASPSSPMRKSTLIPNLSTIPDVPSLDNEVVGNHDDGDGLGNPLSMDTSDDIEESCDGFCQPGVPGCAASLTPPTTPTRGATDYVTPLSGRRSIKMNSQKLKDVMMPGLPGPDPASLTALPYVRRRARSAGNEEEGFSPLSSSESKLDNVENDARRAILLPEPRTGGDSPDKRKSALVVNRKLYRTHRQMRLAVLEASKRFEEEQVRHARNSIIAQREEEEKANEESQIFSAGLVMRHGHKKQVSSESVLRLLVEHREKQQKLVEKATKRGGRGRRSRKKTCSDMSGMLFSAEQTRPSMTVSGRKSKVGPQGTSKTVESLDSIHSIQPIDTPQLVKEEEALEDIVQRVEEEEKIKEQSTSDGPLRVATVPGEFRKTNDPFGSQGRYALNL